MAAYPRYSQTIAALQNVGQTINTLNALDLANKNAALQHDLEMARLELQKKQMQGQQAVSLAQVDRANAEQAENTRRWGEEQKFRVSEEERRAKEFEQKMQDYEYWNEKGTPLKFWSEDWAKNGMSPEEQKKRIYGMTHTDTGVPYPNGEMFLNLQMTRKQALDLFDDMNKFHQELAKTQYEASLKGTSGKKSALEAITEQSDALNKTYNGLLRSWDGSEDSKNRIQRVIQNSSGAEFSVYPYIETVTDKTTGEAKQIKRLQIVPQFIAQDMMETERASDIISRRPWLSTKSGDDDKTITRKINMINRLIQDDVYGNPNKEQEIESMVGTNISVPPHRNIPAQSTITGEQGKGASRSFDYQPDYNKVFREQGLPGIAKETFLSVYNPLISSNVPSTIGNAALMVPSVAKSVASTLGKTPNAIIDATQMLFPRNYNAVPTTTQPIIIPQNTINGINLNPFEEERNNIDNAMRYYRR